MRKLIAIAILVGALATTASASECQSLVFDDRPGIATVSGGQDIRTGIVGTFLWVQYGPNVGQDERANTVSVDVSDLSLEGATVCPDGTVTLIRETPETVDLVESFPEVEVIPSSASWETARPGGVFA